MISQGIPDRNNDLVLLFLADLSQKHLIESPLMLSSMFWKSTSASTGLTWLTSILNPIDSESGKGLPVLWDLFLSVRGLRLGTGVVERELNPSAFFGVPGMVTAWFDW